MEIPEIVIGFTARPASGSGPHPREKGLVCAYAGRHELLWWRPAVGCGYQAQPAGAVPAMLGCTPFGKPMYVA